MRIELNFPRPFLTLSLVAVFVGGVYWGKSSSPATATVAPNEQHVHEDVQAGNDYNTIIAEGGDDTPDALRIREQEEESRRIRIQQEVLQRKADILRGQLRFLEAERRAMGDRVDVNLENQLAQSTAILKSLLQDQQKSEKFLLASLNQIWEAQGRAMALGRGLPGGESGTLEFVWPVEPRLGISASFRDPGYKERFGFEHDAIDIPTAQMTIVRAAADGVVKDVVDHGLGFNYITIQHANGTSTLYGHLSKFIVESGKTVKAGDPIAYSGGRPGTPGAGFSTGPHLHFGVFQNGVAVDPHPFMPAYDLTEAVPVEETSPGA